MLNSLQSYCAPSLAEATPEGKETLSSTNSEQFHRLRELFDKSFKAARIGIWECTLPDETITWTDTVYELFDLEPQQPLLRDDTVALYAPESRRRLTELRSAAIRNGEGFTLDAEIVTAKGNRRWIRITATVERHEGQPVRLFGIKQDITAEKTLFEHIRRQAETDAVTGLASRARFEAVLEDMAIAAGTHCRGLLLFDLDGFKSVNDRLGHQAGDECLKDAGRRIAQALPDADLIARLGGDEFAVIHDCTSPAQLEEIGRRVVARLECWVGAGSDKVKVSASGGAAVILPGTPAKDVFAQADRALYAVKADGKNGFGLCRPEKAERGVAEVA